MTNEEKILKRLESLEKKITPIAESAAVAKELKDELTPRINEAVQALIVELADVETEFQSEKLIYLCKKLMRNIDNFDFVLNSIHNLIDFAVNAEPLLKTSVPSFISFMDELEQKNVFKFLNTALETFKNLLEKYTPEQIEQIVDGFGKLAEIMVNLTNKKTIDLLEKASKMPAKLELEKSKAGAFTILKAINDEQVKQGLGVLIEITKGLSTLKN